MTYTDTNGESVFGDSCHNSHREEEQVRGKNAYVAKAEHARWKEGFVALVRSMSVSPSVAGR